MNFLLNKTRWVCIGITYIMLIIALVLFARSSTNAIDESEQLKARLDSIQQELHGYVNNVTSPANSINIDALNQEIKQITHSMNQLKTTGDSKLSQLLAESQSEIKQQLDAIQKIIISLNKKTHPIQYLPVSALPFQIVSVDSIQQVPVATVRYDFKTHPLEKSDKLAGWALIDLDFGKQSLRFENVDKEQVVVQLGQPKGGKHA